MLFRALGWGFTARYRRDGVPVPDVAELSASRLTVKTATLLQSQAAFDERARRREAFVASALGLAAAPGVGAAEDEAAPGMSALDGATVGVVAAGSVVGAGGGGPGFLARLRRAWDLPWDNRYKELLWRLSVDGVVGAGGHDVVCGGACPCGWTPPRGDRSGLEGAGRVARSHYFWGCPVAGAVVAEVKRGWPSPPALSAVHLWLLLAPDCHPAVHPQAWLVVCLAALDAMETGRRALWQASMAGAAGEQAVHRACRRAAATFWCSLQDFAELHSASVPSGWDSALPGGPFLQLTSVMIRDGAAWQPCIRLSLPPEFTFPSDS